MANARLATAAVAAVFAVGCGQKWEGFVYPNRGDLSTHIAIGSHDSLEACRAAALNVLVRVSSPAAGDYECGLNCETRAGLDGIKVCEKTER